MNQEPKVSKDQVSSSSPTSSPSYENTFTSPVQETDTHGSADTTPSLPLINVPPNSNHASSKATPTGDPLDANSDVILLREFVLKEQDVRETIDESRLMT